MRTNLYYNYGPPGCGKTTSLEQHAREAVEEHGSDGVVLTSLTNAAANEIKSRGIEIKTGQVGTLHSLAKKSLGKNIKVVQVKGFNEEFPQYKLTTADNGVDSEGAKESMQSRTKGDQLLAQLNIYIGQA
jgi:superfamily I DNA/RNA helicase